MKNETQEGEILTKGFIASIFEDKRIGNCSNNGISKWHKEVMIVTTIKEMQIFDITPKSELSYPLVVIKKNEKTGYIWAEPIDDTENGNVGWMMGGSFIYSSDSRFRRHINPYPIPLHDRQETQELNERLSR